MTKEKIRIAIETIDDLGYNTLGNDLFELLEKLILAGHTISLYRILSSKHTEEIQEYKDVQHLRNFKRSLQYPFKPIY